VKVLVTERALWDLAIDEGERAFVSVAGDGSIYEILADGTLRTVSPGGMVMPGGVAVVARPDGEPVYVADWTSFREYDGLSGELLSSVYEGVASPQTVSILGDKLILTSWWAPAIQIWDPQKQEEVQRIEYDGPINAIEFQGDLVVAERYAVRRMKPGDSRKQILLVETTRHPAGLVATEEDLWVGDYENGEILQVVAGGEVLDEPEVVATGLEGPEGLAFAPDGRLLVVETHAGRLSAIDLATGEMATVMDGLEVTAEGPEDWPDTWVFNGVAVGPSGAVYVTANRANVLFPIPPG
jgi:sugar lactone lactonase YvrE